MRVVTGLACLGLAGCSAAADLPPTSLCETSVEALSRWVGANVRWEGLLVATGNHGMFLAGECPTRRGIPVVALPGGPQTEKLEALLTDKQFRPGALRIELTGKLVDHGLAVTEIHEFHFADMREEQDAQFWSAIGYPGL